MWRICVVVWLSLPLVLSCNWGSPPSGGASGADAPAGARDLIDRMLKAYHEASSYADSGQLLVRYDRENGERISEDVDCSVTFARPNKLRMHFYQAIVVSDGKDLRATVLDLPNQVLSVPTPQKVNYETLYTDPILTSVLTQGIAGPSVQLALLVEDNPLGGLLEGADAPTLLEPSEADGAACYRVQFNPAFGKVVFWIDKKSYVVRRIDFAEVVGRNWLRERGQDAGNVSLVAEFKGARLNEKVDEKAFQFAPPENAKLVDQLIYQPKLLGQKAPAFEFRALGGGTVGRESLAGKVAVIAFWDATCEPFFRELPDLEKVYQKYKDNEKVAFLAVSIDGAQTTDDQLREIFTKAKTAIPILRDPQQHAQSAFEIQLLPSLFVVGADGTVQFVQTEYNAELATQLPQMLDKLLAGQSVYEEAMRENERRQRKVSGGPAGSNDAAPASVVELPKVDIAARSGPKRLKLAPLWTCGELKQPGNILCVQRPDAPPQLLVCDGWRTIVELDAAGKVAARHELDIPPSAVVSYLRTAVADKAQRYFVGCASAQQQLHVFDADFKRLLSYPAEGQHAGIYDVQLADLDADGQPELNVGYLGVVGVQNAALDGTRRWSNRSVENVLSLAASGPAASGERHLLAAAAGAITPIDDRGKSGPAVRIEGRFARLIVAADLRGDGKIEYCCVAAIRAGMDTAVGLSADVREQWQYELPLGAQTVPALEMIASGRVVGQEGQWLLAGADGSIHILAADGSLVDRFNYGAAISGLGVVQLNSQPTLLVATEKGVDAWTVQGLATP